MPFYKIIVVDNKSPNESFKILKEKYKNNESIIVLSSDKNGGFAYGNNYGIRYAIRNFDFDNLLLINNDTIADERIHEKFLQTLDIYKNEKIGIITGKIYYYDKKDTIWFGGGYFDKLRCSGYHLHIGKKDKTLNESMREITFATGCLWFIPLESFKNIGYLPEEYFLYVEDVDYSLMTIKKGYKIIYNPNIRIWHKIGSSSGLTKENPDYRWLNRNRIILCRKYLNFFDRLKFYLFFFSSRVIRFVQYLLKGKFVNTFKGVLEGFRFNIKKEEASK